MTRALALSLIAAMGGCQGSSPTAGTETGNALVVGGSGAGSSAGVELDVAAIDLARVDVQDAACEGWETVARDVAVDALGDPTRVTLDQPVCGVRLLLARVRAAGQRPNGRAVNAESGAFELTFQFTEAVAEPFVRFDVTGWLVGGPEPSAADLERGVRRGASARQDGERDDDVDDGFDERD